MRIALVVTGGLHPSGREQVVPGLLALVRQLAVDHEVHAFVLRHLPRAQRYSLAGATIHDLGRPTGVWRQYRALAAAVAKHRPFDVVHGYWGVPSGLVAALAGHRFRIPSIVTASSGEFVSLPEIGYGLQRTPRTRAAVATACRLARVVHVTSQYMLTLARQHGLDAVVVPLGIDTRRFAVGDSKRDGPPWRLLQVASINRVKDHSMLLRALALLRQTMSVELDLAGEDTLDGRVHDEARALGIADAVRFHGFVAHDELPILHRQAHAYVQSSQHEAAGMAVLEAAAAGLPIVGTRVGFVSDWDGSAAIGVPPGDSQALAAALSGMLNEPPRRAALARAAHARAQHYDVQDTTRRLVALYEFASGAEAG
jgi:glycosyltransferase involved in cell wall biosynthesis